MMTYKDFLDYVKENILSCMPPEYSHAEVDIFKVTKDNNLVLDGMTIRKDANGPSPIIYLEQYYGRITDKKDAKTVIEEIASDYFSAFKYYKGLTSFDPSNWDLVRGKVGYYILNAELNKERLKDKVFKSEGEMVKVYIIIADFQVSQYNFMLIPQDLFAEWEISEEELDNAAEANMAAHFPPVLLSMEENMKERKSGRPAANLLRRGRALKPDIMYVLTNRSRLNGASVILYPGLLEKVRKVLRKDYYIIPFSTEEVIVVPKKSDIRGRVLEEILRENNRRPGRNNILSGCIYEYTSENQSMTIAAECLA